MRPGRHRSNTRLALIMVIGLAFALRIYHLGTLELTFDEALSANVSAMDWAGILTYVRSQPLEHPPAYYLLLHLWQQVTGDSAFSLRFFSLFWGVLFVPLLYVLLKRLSGERLALLTALLAAVSPFLVASSQEARMYTLVPCLALLALLAFQQALFRENRPGWWLAYLAMVAVGVATHYYFALIWAVTTAYLFLEWPPRFRTRLYALAVQSLFLVAGIVWLIAAPGPRASLLRVFQGEFAFSLSYKLDKVMPVLMLAEIRLQEIPAVARFLAAGGWLLVLLGVLWSGARLWRAAPHAANLPRTPAEPSDQASHRSPVMQPLDRQSWRFLILILLAPLCLSLLIPYGVLGRHLGYTLAAGLSFLALGLLALARRGRLWLAAGILLVLSMSTYGLIAQYTISKGDFGQALGYIDDHGQPGDLLLLTQPLAFPLADYYNRLDWPIRYLPSAGGSLTQAGVLTELQSLAPTHPRIWLGPAGAWTADPDSLVERLLVTRAYQADKSWFPDSTSVALYFMPRPLEAVALGQGIAWEGGIRLLSAEHSSSVLAPGDALRLSLTWQASQPTDSPYLVSLYLVDDAGQVWSVRQSEPCSGLCPTTAWSAGGTVRDNHALLVPPGTPPGLYRLQIAWYVPAIGRELTGEPGDPRVDLGQVQVVTDPVPRKPSTFEPAAENLLHAEFAGEIALLGYDQARLDVRAGQTVDLELHWLALSQSTSDYKALWELVGSDGVVHASWERPLVADFYPTSQWQAREYLRGLHPLLLPANLPAGNYRLRLSLLDGAGQPLPVSGSRPRQALGGVVNWAGALQGYALDLASLHVSDRPHNFDVPQMGSPLHAVFSSPAALQNGTAQPADEVELLGYDLDTGAAAPGGRIALTLYFRGRGATARSYKVFTHLGDGVNPPLAQDDGTPGSGCCPTDTWLEGEVVVDRHGISLPVELPPGDYWLTVGMYDESTGQRLAVADGPGAKGDQLFVAQVAVRPAPTENARPALLLSPWLHLSLQDRSP